MLGKKKNLMVISIVVNPVVAVYLYTGWICTCVNPFVTHHHGKKPLSDCNTKDKLLENVVAARQNQWFLLIISLTLRFESI